MSCSNFEPNRSAIPSAGQLKRVVDVFIERVMVAYFPFSYYSKSIQEYSRSFPDFPIGWIPEIADLVNQKLPKKSWYSLAGKYIEERLEKGDLPINWQLLCCYLLFCNSENIFVIRDVHHKVHEIRQCKAFRFLLSRSPKRFTLQGTKIQFGLDLIWGSFKFSKLLERFQQQGLPIDLKAYRGDQYYLIFLRNRLSKALALHQADLEVVRKILPTKRDILTFLSDSDNIVLLKEDYIPQFLEYIKNKLTVVDILDSPVAIAFYPYLKNKDIRCYLDKKSEEIAHELAKPPRAWRRAILDELREFCRRPENHRFFRLLPESRPDSDHFNREETLEREKMLIEDMFPFMEGDLCTLVLSVVKLRTETYL